MRTEAEAEDEAEGEAVRPPREVAFAAVFFLRACFGDLPWGMALGCRRVVFGGVEFERCVVEIERCVVEIERCVVEIE